MSVKFRGFRHRDTPKVSWLQSWQYGQRPTYPDIFLYVDCVPEYLGSGRVQIAPHVFTPND